MEIVSSVWHVVSSFIVFLFGTVCVVGCSRYFHIRQDRALFLYLWHSIFCLLYVFYSLSNVSDSTMYFTHGAAEPEKFSLGTFAILWVVYILRFFDLSYLGVFLVFNIFGSIGLLAFYASLNQVVRLSSLFLRWMVLVIVLLPSVSFWSSALGKDSIAFMAVGLVLWATLNLENRKLLMVFAILAMLFVRPHIAGMLVISIGIAVFFQGNASAIQRILVGSLATVVAAILIPFSLEYAGLGGVSNVGDVQAYIGERQSYNQGGGGGIDISSMSLPMQLFTYLLRPLSFEAKSIPALAASIENLVLLFLVLYYCFSKIKCKSIECAESLVGNRIFMWCYVGMSWIVLATTTANLGISVRQKWMFAPVLIFLIISFISSRKRVKKMSVN